jgi:hypothetical protein
MRCCCPPLSICGKLGQEVFDREYFHFFEGFINARQAFFAAFDAIDDHRLFENAFDGHKWSHGSVGVLLDIAYPRAVILHFLRLHCAHIFAVEQHLTLVGRYSPRMVFIRLDFPQPLSPTTAIASL